MITRIKQWLAPPALGGDEEQSRQAALLNQILLSFIGVDALMILSVALGTTHLLRVLVTMLLFLALTLLLRRWLFLGRVGQVKVGAVSLAYVQLTLVVAEMGTIRVPASATYLLLVLLAGLLFELRGILVTTAAVSLAVLGLIAAENAGLLTTPSYAVNVFHWVNYTILFGVAAYLAHYSVQSTRRAMERTRQEVEQRKRDQQRIAEALEFSQRIVDSSPLGIVTYTLAGEAVTANAAAVKILGVPYETIVQRNLYAMADRVSNGMAAAADQALRTGQPVTRPVHYSTATAGDLQLIVSFAPFTLRGEPHLLVMFEDDSERQRAVAALQEAHDELEQRVEERTEALNQANLALERALSARDEFLSTMSHELRTPLTGILGFSEALQSSLSSGLNERQLKAARHIETSGRRLLDLVNDVLDFTRIQAGKMELSLLPCSLGGICRRSLQNVAGKAGDRRQQVEFSMNPETIMLKVDERRIGQVLSNLLDNAVKFTPEGGRITLAVRGLEEEGLVQIQVIDTGIGIKENDLPRLFQAFVQMEGGLTRRYEGTGLGLALVKALVEVHGGRVTVESTPGQGSCFTVFLPWEEEGRNRERF